MDCVYEVEQWESAGLVVKWYLNTQLVYQWIPPRRPQALGALAGRVDPSFRASPHPWSAHRALYVPSPQPALSGLLSCAVSTFGGEDSRSAPLLVWSKPKQVSLNYRRPYAHLVNLTCTAAGGAPRPLLVLYAVSPGGYRQEVATKGSEARRREDGRWWVRVWGVLSWALTPPNTTLGCSLTWPGTSPPLTPRTVEKGYDRAPNLSQPPHSPQPQPATTAPNLSQTQTAPNLTQPPHSPQFQPATTAPNLSQPPHTPEPQPATTQPPTSASHHIAPNLSQPLHSPQPQPDPHSPQSQPDPHPQISLNPRTAPNLSQLSHSPQPQPDPQNPQPQPDPHSPQPQPTPTQPPTPTNSHTAPNLSQIHTAPTSARSTQPPTSANSNTASNPNQFPHSPQHQPDPHSPQPQPDPHRPQPQPTPTHSPASAKQHSPNLSQPPQPPASANQHNPKLTQPPHSPRLQPASQPLGQPSTQPRSRVEHQSSCAPPRTPPAGHSAPRQEGTRGGAARVVQCGAAPRLLHTQLHNETVTRPQVQQKWLGGCSTHTSTSQMPDDNNNNDLNGYVDQRQPHREVPVKACMSSPLHTSPSPESPKSSAGRGWRTSHRELWRHLRVNAWLGGGAPQPGPAGARQTSGSERHEQRRRSSVVIGCW
ncbi:hypothetical protein O3P69_011190 [Scylla paramamosain]|uniref:Uncharacterized protein n=1 Tax=Scylla paramamosain TaxID=85552 RepID=A0AAW0SUV6_SCYPA